MSQPPWEPARPPVREPPTGPMPDPASHRLGRRFPLVPDADTVLLPADRKKRPPAPPPEPIRQNGHAARPAPRESSGGPAAWPQLPGPRRTWVSRGVLLVIMIVQAVLTLRMSNTAFEDEALYLYAGHMELSHLLYGASLQGDYAAYFSGAPVLYPVLGAVADNLGGLAAARAASLLAMLAVTGLLYSLTRRLFNERVGLCAALIFSVTEAAIFVGHLATYDATSLCLLAVAAWLVVRTAPLRWPAYLLAAPVAAAAAAVKYAALLFLPTVVVLAALAAWPYRGRRVLARPVLLAAATAALLAAALHRAGPGYLHSIEFTTVHRFTGTTPLQVLLLDLARWGALPFGLAVIGAVAYVVRAQTEAGEHIAPPGGRWRRALLGIALAGTALLAPAEQIRLHTETALDKHIGFGLFFAAPLAGIGLARIVGDHFRRAQLGIAIWGAALVLGMTAANDLFHSWPSSQAMVATMRRYLQPGGHYLVEVDEVPIYYLQDYLDAQPRQFTSTYLINYRTRSGGTLTGTAGYKAAIRAGYFRVICYDRQVTPALDATIQRVLQADPDYRLAATIPYGNGSGSYYIWVRR